MGRRFSIYQSGLLIRCQQYFSNIGTFPVLRIENKVSCIGIDLLRVGLKMRV